MDLDALRSLAGQSFEQNLDDSRLFANLLYRIYSFPKPIIAAVNGAAIAGGCGIATLCDFTLAVPEAKFGYTEVKIGFIPAVVSVFLRRQVGDKIARDLLISGRIIDAAEAYRLGLITEIVPAANLTARAQEFAGILLAASPTSIARTKRLLLGYDEAALEGRTRNRHPRKRRYSLHRRFSRGPFFVPRKARAEMDGPLNPRWTMNFSAPMKDYAETTVRVRYAETDQMGIVYYGNYFTWFEIGRVELCRQLGFEYKQMEIEDDSFIIVAEAQCRYKKPARFDDVLTIRTRVTQSQRRTLRFGYEILNHASGELLATGETLHVICDRRGRPKSLPEKYRNYFPASRHHAAASSPADPQEVP